MASYEAALLENAVPKLYYLKFITMGISTILDEHVQQVKFYLKPSIYTRALVLRLTWAKVSSIQTPMLIWARLERTEINLMHFK